VRLGNSLNKQESDNLAIEGNADFAKKLAAKYGMKVPEDVIASVYGNNLKLRVFLSRASFRADATRSNESIRVQRERRNLLRNLLGLVAISVPSLLVLKVAFFSPQPQTPIYVANPGSQPGNQVLANASEIPVGESLTLSDPSLGPIILVHLQSAQFVAYIAICTHAGCIVQFNPTARDIACPCHGAVFDPYNNAQVLAGPAPYPLREVPIRFDQSSGNIYLAA